MTKRRPAYSRVFKNHTDADARAKLAVEIWTETVSELEENGLKTKPRLRLVDQYVRAMVEYEFLYPVAMSEGPTHKSGGGGEYANMKWSAIGKLSTDISKWADSLLITPKSADGKVVKPVERKATAADEFIGG